MENQKINLNTDWDLVTLRGFEARDITPYVQYWQARMDEPGSTINPKFFSTTELQRYLTDEPAPVAQQWSIVIEYNGVTAGVINLNELVRGDSADVHAHFWEKSMRGKGIGYIGGVKAGYAFMKRFDLKKLYAKPPVSNPMSSRLMEKFSFRHTGTCELNYPMLKPGIKANVYESTLEELVKTFPQVELIDLSALIEKK